MSIAGNKKMQEFNCRRTRRQESFFNTRASLVVGLSFNQFFGRFHITVGYFAGPKGTAGGFFNVSGV